MAVLLTASTAFANISTDYDHKVNIGHYKTYSWAAVKTSDSLWDQRVRDAVNSELAARGWTLVPSGGEVAVTARDAIHNQQTLNTFYDGFGGRRFGGLGMSTTTVDNYQNRHADRRDVRRQQQEHDLAGRCQRHAFE